MLTLTVPNLLTPWRLALLGLAVALAACLGVGAERAANLADMLGDTDDALRLVVVRDLLDGQPWFDNHVARLQPPIGLDLHWSRLMDAGLAGEIRLFSLVLDSSAAERAARFVWPLPWLALAAISAALLAARLGGAAALLPCGLLLVLSPAVFIQFWPGRIDHHNVQIALTLVVLTALLHLDRHRAAGWVAGAASGLLLGIGLEALVFAALAGAAIEMWLVFDASLAVAARRYATGLILSTCAVFLLQVPPDRWARPACDALAINLLAAVILAAAGLALAATAAARGASPPTSPSRRLLALLAPGAGAAAAYALIEPACLAGPYGQLDPNLWPQWLDHVMEAQTLAQTLRADPLTSLSLAIGPVVGLVALIVALSSAERRRDPAWLIAGAALLVSIAFLLVGVRSAAYATWLAVPVTAAALTAIPSVRQNLLVPALAAAMIASPALPLALATRFAPPAEAASGSASACEAAGSFAHLARLPPGLVVSEIDLGPFILAHTPHSAMSAPYHRMGFGISTAHDILAGAPETSRDMLERHGVRYVVLCPQEPDRMPYRRMPPDSLYKLLRRDAAPSWLREIPGERPLKVYAVEPRAS